MEKQSIVSKMQDIYKEISGGKEIKSDALLFSSEFFVNPSFMVDYVDEVESSMGVRLASGEFTYENFSSIDALATLIEQKIKVQRA